MVTFVVSRTVSEIRPLIGRKSPIRTHPTLIQCPRSGWPPSNFGINVISPETRMMGLPYGEEIIIVGECDRRTDRQTDGRTELRSQRPCNAERRTVKISLLLFTCIIWIRTGLLYARWCTRYNLKNQEIRSVECGFCPIATLDFVMFTVVVLLIRITIYVHLVNVQSAYNVSIFPQTVGNF